MKKYIKHIAIISFLVIAQIGAFTLKAHAQIRITDGDKWVSTLPKKSMGDSIHEKSEDYRVLIADETTITYLKNDAKIECNNQEVFYKLFTSYYQLFTRFTATWKVDKIGNAYKHYVIHLNKEDAELVKTWAKTNL